MGRVHSAAKNIAFGQIGNLITQLLGFVLRTVFIAHLGDTLIVINDMYRTIYNNHKLCSPFVYIYYNYIKLDIILQELKHIYNHAAQQDNGRGFHI